MTYDHSTLGLIGKEIKENINDGNFSSNRVKSQAIKAEESDKASGGNKVILY